MLLRVLGRNDGARYAESCSAGPYAYESGKLDEQCDLFYFWSVHAGGAHFAQGLSITCRVNVLRLPTCGTDGSTLARARVPPVHPTCY